MVGGFVEAADNDTISGPKVSASAVIRVRIADPRERANSRARAMEKLGEDLLQLLADELDLQARYEELAAQAGAGKEFPWEAADEAAAAQKQGARVGRARRGARGPLAEALDRDPAAGEEGDPPGGADTGGDCRAARAAADPRWRTMAGVAAPGGVEPGGALQKTGFLAATAGKAARTAEELALMAEAMKRERRMADVSAARRRWPRPRTASSRASRALPRRPQGRRGGPQAAGQIERELQDLAQALQKESEDLPEEFLNSEAVKGLDLGEVMDAAAQVREASASGRHRGGAQGRARSGGEARGPAQQPAQGREDVDRRQRQALDRLGGRRPPGAAGPRRAPAGAARTHGGYRGAGRAAARAGAARDGARAKLGSPAGPSPTCSRPRSAVASGRSRASRRGAGDGTGLAAEVAALRAALPFLPAEVGPGLEAAAGLMA